MPTYITVPIPDDIRRYMQSLFHENFNLWIFLALNDLLDEARDFLALDHVTVDGFENLPF